MTPEETKAMADRIAKTRQEEAKTAVKAVKVKGDVKVKAPPVKHAPKEAVMKKAKAVKVKKVAKAKASKRVPGPAMAKFKFKAGTKSRSTCDVLNCKAKPTKGFRCNKHRKLIRKAQLAANNVVWKKCVKAGTAGHHVVYTRPGEKAPIATRWSLSKKTTELAMKKVTNGHSIVEKVGEFKEILARTKKIRAAA